MVFWYTIVENSGVTWYLIMWSHGTTSGILCVHVDQTVVLRYLRMCSHGHTCGVVVLDVVVFIWTHAVLWHLGVCLVLDCRHSPVVFVVIK